MLKKIETYLFNKLAGKLLARAAVTIAGFVASSAVQAALAKAGIHGVVVDPSELTAGMIALSHAAFEAFKAWRSPKPAQDAPEPPKTA